MVQLLSLRLYSTKREVLNIFDKRNRIIISIFPLSFLNLDALKEKVFCFRDCEQRDQEEMHLLSKFHLPSLKIAVNVSRGGKSKIGRQSSHYICSEIQLQLLFEKVLKFPFQIFGIQMLHFNTILNCIGFKKQMYSLPLLKRSSDKSVKMQWTTTITDFKMQ